MSKFTDYIDGLQDKAGTLAKEELKSLISSARNDESEFVRFAGGEYRAADYHACSRRVYPVRENCQKPWREHRSAL